MTSTNTYDDEKSQKVSNNGHNRDHGNNLHIKIPIADKLTKMTLEVTQVVDDLSPERKNSGLNFISSRLSNIRENRQSKQKKGEIHDNDDLI